MAITKRTSRRSTCSNAQGNRPAHLRHLRPQPRAIAFAVGAALLPWTFLDPALAQTTASTLPAGGQVAAGSATLTYSPNKLQIDQSTGKAIINWDSFSIGSSAWVNFSQPSSSAVALNRVVGSNPTEIYGRLTANGSVFFTNPNGVLFARGASVEVGSLFATTLSIADQDFLAGRYNFYNAGSAGAVLNEGNIIAANGYAALAGPQVRNDGIIVAHAGTVALAAGDRVTLDMIGDGLIKVSVDQAATNASAINAGTIQADGGNVILTARSANALLDTVVNNSGVIRANSLVERNGEIVLDGGSAGVVSNTGTLSAAGTDAGTTGGTVKVLGDKVTLLSGSSINVSGDAGGGTALIGGNFHGAGPEQNASTTTLEAGAAINADAISFGDGGRVAVWSDGHTTVGGALNARGGADSGNGGFVETSGKQLTIGEGTSVKTSAPNGQAGNWLLDPVDFVIAAVGGDITGSTLGTNLNGGNIKIRSSDGTVGGTNGDILVQDAVTWTSTNTLELSAFRNITFNASGALTATGGPGNVILRADNTGIGTGTVTVGGGGGSINAGVVTVYYNPTSYAALTDYSVGQGITATTVNSHAWIFLSGATVGSKTYDGTTSATIGTQASFVGDPTAVGANAVTLNTAGATATFSDMNAGVAKTVNLLGYSLGGADAAKFAIFDNAGTFAAPGAAATFQTTTTANIAPAVVNLAGSRVYDATTTFNASAFGTAGTISTGIGVETLVLTGSGSVASSHVAAGSQALTLGTLALTNGTGLASNYTLAGGTDTGTVTAAPVSFTGTRAYDGTTTFAASTFGTAGTINTGIGVETLVLTGSGSVASSHVAAGPQAVTLGTLALTNGTGTASDYTFSGGTQTASVTAATVSLSATRAYDGTTNFTAGSFTPTITGTVGGETLTIAGGTGTVASRDVSAGTQTLAIGTLTLGNGTGQATDYTFTGGAHTGTITQLGSVAWVGGPSGNWSVAGNWAGGAIPDKNNVVNVDLSGGTVTFDATVPTLAGSVQISNLSNGSLAMNSSSLSIGSSLNLAGYSQTGGAVSTGGSFTVTNSFSQTAGTIASTGLVNITQGSGALTALNISGSNAVTLTANTSGGDITLASGGSLTGTTVTLTAGRNVGLNSGITGTVVNINFGQQVAGRFTPTSSISGTTTVTGGANADIFDFTGAPSITASLNGGLGTDTLRQSGGKIWNLNNTTADAGTSGTLTWASIENLQDTGAGIFNMGTAGSVSDALGAVNGSINYGSYATPVAFNLNGGASTGMAGWTGITSVTGSAATSDTIMGTGTYTITGPNAGNNGTVSWSSFENLNGLGSSTLQATSATWNLSGSNTGTVTNLSGTFLGMANLTDLGTATVNMGSSGSVTGNLNGGTNGSMTYASYGSGVAFSLSGAAGSTTGIGGTRTGITSVTGSANPDVITGSSATYNLTGSNSGNASGISWTSFENIADATAGTFNLTVASNNVTGTLSSGGSATLSSSLDISALNTSIPGTLTMSGTANTWNLTGTTQPSLFQTTNPNANVYFNGTCVGGPACGTIIVIVGTIGSTVAQIAAQALKDAQSTDSVAKIIDYGFAGDVGTTPPMDHRIDVDGISTPQCFEESRESAACKNN